MQAAPTSIYRRLYQNPWFALGFKDLMQAAPATFIWGLFTGVAMVKSGLSIPLALLMTFIVYAGSAQLAALPLLAAGASVAVIWFTALIVNIRFIIFSAGMVPYLRDLPLMQRLQAGFILGDINFALQMKNQAQHGDAFAGDNAKAYFLGTGVANWVVWQCASVLGVLLTPFIPTDWGLEFAAILALVALVSSFVKSVAALVSLIVGGAVALLTQALPMRLGLVLAVLAGMLAGWLAQYCLSKRSA